MKTGIKNIFTLVSAVLFSISFTTIVHAESFKSPSFGGATGLISTPTSHTGWEGSGLGLDVAYHYIDENDDTNGEGYHIPLALLHLGIAGTNLEVGFAYDIQPDWDTDDETDDMIISAKWEFTEGLAIGGNAQLIDRNDSDDERHDFQLYVVATYPGNFFSMPAETTIVIGHTFWGEDRAGRHDNENIDFSMGFDLDFAPQLFKHYVHWISDFSNYSYSTEAGGADAWSRGCFNTGGVLMLLSRMY